MSKKPNKTTTIEIAIETYNRIHSIKTQIEKIVNRKVSFDRVLKIFFALRPLDVVLTNLILEEAIETHVQT